MIHALCKQHIRSPDTQCTTKVDCSLDHRGCHRKHHGLGQGISKGSNIACMIIGYLILRHAFEYMSVKDEKNLASINTAFQGAKLRQRAATAPLLFYEMYGSTREGRKPNR
jgi:hypothetical protein